MEGGGVQALRSPAGLRVSEVPRAPGPPGAAGWQGASGCCGLVQDRNVKRDVS